MIRIALALAALSLLSPLHARALDHPLADTGQAQCYDGLVAIDPPAPGEAFHGQDAQVQGQGPAYELSADGLTVTDLVTGLVWQRRADTDLDGVLEPEDKLAWSEALQQPALLNAQAFGGHDDWRLPDIKTLYSLIDFRGTDPSGMEDPVDPQPFLGAPFDFIYGDEAGGERLIDAQYWSATEYVSTTMNGDHTVFGVNFADGRIKGYGTNPPPGAMTGFVLCVRGGPAYGQNQFVDNGDGTVDDRATGLTWTQADSGEPLSWEEALAWAEALELGGRDDWRLPNAKELQSLVDYSRSPATHGTAAIDPLFACSAIVAEGGQSDFPFYWTSTTHANMTLEPGHAAAYLAFGTGYGWMQAPFPPFDYVLMDVHGAGCQRSDPKLGDPADYPHGHGPQGDVIRVFNFARAVRDTDLAAPPAVDDLGVRLEGGAVELSWSAPAADLAGYAVYASADPWAAFPHGWTLVGEPVAPGWSEALAESLRVYRVTARR